MPFDGRIPNTNIVIDNCAARYDGCYFLITHPHTDHTKGLTSKFTKGAIHCSQLCKELLLMRHPSIQQHNPIIGHEIGSTFTLSPLQTPERRGIKKRRSRINNNNTYNSSNSNSNNSNQTDDIDSEDEWRKSEANGVQISLIDANHCPGSVMFLIKSTNGKIYLHTGDYRTSNEMINNKLLTNVWIDMVYMDVTFCAPSSIFPSKKDIAIQTINYIKAKKKDKQWKKKNNMSFKIIYIEVKQLGAETFLIEMCKRLKTKMWADSRSWQYKMFMHFKDTKKYMTLDQSEAMIHIPFSFYKFVHEDKKYRKENNLSNVMYISPTTMYFVMRNWCNTPIKVDNNGITHVLYSMHCGYDDMRTFISKLNVKQVMPFHEPFMHQKWDNFDAVRYVRKHFEDCIERDPTESKDVFVPNLNNNSNSMDIDIDVSKNKTKNALSCIPTALNKDAQNEKFLRIRNMMRQNKQRLTQCVDNKSPKPKRMNTAPVVTNINKYGGKRGALNQDRWINSMTQMKNVKEFHMTSPPKIERAISDCTPMLPKRNRKRKLIELIDDKDENINGINNNNASKKRKIALRNTQYNISSEESTLKELMNGQSVSSLQTNSNQSPDLSLSCEKKGILGKYKLSTQLPINKMPNLKSPQSEDSGNTFDGMDIDDSDAKMEILDDDNDITPGDIGNDDSTINEGSQISNNVRYAPYKTYDNGIRKPFYISQYRVKGRSYMIYKEDKWDKHKLNNFLNVIINTLQMKRVYTAKNAKFIIVDLDMMNNNESKDDILYKLGYEYYNGDHSIREVWNYKIFECIKICNFMRGTLSKQFNGKLDDYYIMSTHNVNENYLKSQNLWPLKPKINEYPTRN